MTLCIVVLGGLALYVMAGQQHGSEQAAASAGRPGTGAQAGQEPKVAQRGRETFTRATGSSQLFGKGRPLRYGVDVEDGIGQDPDTFAKEVDHILADARGWTANGTAFQRADGPPYDFTVHLASPDTTDTLCAKYGLDTGGEVNCSGGPDVVVNLKRWLLLSPYYKGQPDMYHALIVNHEVGHRLGRGHQGCAGRGKPAPVMMQQIKGLHGCTPNAWPYDSDGRPIDGPSAP
ncbi:DUF3152 domain-containing protein [Streptomyces sp. NPDC019890]|uniref:DUF3152 domain-containing protein n=1 Tax=Streptomyces sp. NPDC019890 TaxID=3365064 RepID=UPI00384C8FA2